MLQVTIFQIQFGWREDGLLRVDGITDAVLVVRDDTEGVRRGRQQTLEAHCEFLHWSTGGSGDGLPTDVVWNE